LKKKILVDEEENKHRYKNPSSIKMVLTCPSSVTNGKYSDDIFAAYATSFIEKNKQNNFFLYFSFSECHVPFTPPPNHPRYPSFDPLTDYGDKQYFPYMVSYMDSKINTIIQKVVQAGLADKTYIFYYG
jgi:arylsulfatase A-like enzyme